MTCFSSVVNNVVCAEFMLRLVSSPNAFSLQFFPSGWRISFMFRLLCIVLKAMYPAQGRMFS